MDKWIRLSREEKRIRSERNRRKIIPLSVWMEISCLKNEASVKCMVIEDERSDYIEHWRLLFANALVAVKPTEIWFTTPP